VFGEFVADDCACVADEGFDDTAFEGESEVEVRPGLVAVLDGGKAEDKVVHVLKIAVAFAFVAEAEHDRGHLDVSEGYVVGRAVDHLGEVVGLLGLFAVVGPVPQHEAGPLFGVTVDGDGVFGREPCRRPADARPGGAHPQGVV
jgi:hypothetical protein